MKSKTVAAGIAGGIWGGVVVGAGEALAAWLHGHGAGELPAFAWAAIAYGLAGAGVGLAAGLAAVPLRTGAFGLGLGGAIAGLGFVVLRFRIIRDVLLEQVPHGIVPVLGQGVAAVAAAAVAAAIWYRLRPVDGRRPWFARPPVSALVVVVVAGAWAGVARVASTPPREAAPSARAAAPDGAPNVVLIAVDTLRADHLSCYGHAANRTPAIDALAADGVRFARAFAQASWTRPSMATILTGLYPSSHGAVHKADALPDRVDTLAELLAAGGYYATAFVDNVNIAPTFNFQQGFAEYHYLAPALLFGASDPAAQLALYSGLRLVRERFLTRRVDVHHYYRPAEEVTAAAVRWLDAPGGRERPFFLFVHYMDPHDPYFVHPFDGEGYARVAHPNPAPAERDRYRGLYDGEIAYLDEHLGGLVRALRDRDLYDDALIVLTADHGEEFHEHGGWWHGTTLYDEQTHVPLVVKAPRGARAGTVVSGLVTSLDIVPTVLAEAGIAIPATLPGRPLLARDGGASGHERVFAEEDFEGNVLQAVRTPQWKLITANAGNPRGLRPEELYDVGRDPGETTDVAASADATREELRAALGRAVVEARAEAGAGAQGAIDTATSERLRALGYTQ
jgi:arylsulfatase A-like enzyme